MPGGAAGRNVDSGVWVKTMKPDMKYLQGHPGIARNGVGDPLKNATAIEKIKFNPNSRYE